LPHRICLTTLLHTWYLPLHRIPPTYLDALADHWTGLRHCPTHETPHTHGPTHTFTPGPPFCHTRFPHFGTHCTHLPPPHYHSPTTHHTHIYICSTTTLGPHSPPLPTTHTYTVGHYLWTTHYPAYPFTPHTPHTCTHTPACHTHTHTGRTHYTTATHHTAPTACWATQRPHFPCIHCTAYSHLYMATGYPATHRDYLALPIDRTPLQTDLAQPIPPFRPQPTPHPSHTPHTVGQDIAPSPTPAPPGFPHTDF